MMAFFIDGSRPIVPLIKAYRRADVAIGQPRRDSALHADRVPARRGQVVRAAAARAARRCSAGRRAERPSPRRRSARSSRCSPADPGVTILALGGLLLPALLKEGYRERFAIGLLTASGSLGLLFPLSVPLILYGIVAQNVAIEDLFIGGLMPGLLMLALLAGLGVREAVHSGAKHAPFRHRRSRPRRSGTRSGRCCCRSSCSGRCSAATRRRRSRRRSRPSTRSSCSASSTATWPRFKDVVRVAGDCVALVGGVLIILSVAVGLTNYLVNAQVPTQLIEWTQAHIESSAGCSCSR